MPACPGRLSYLAIFMASHLAERLNRWNNNIQATCYPIDIHCHQPITADYPYILSLETHETANEILAFPSDCYFSLGIHPWFLERQDIEAAMQKMAAADAYPNLMAIGECGLDKCISTPMALQIEIFNFQVELAELLGKPLIIHCVKAFNELIQIKKTRKPNSPWIIHGFNANAVICKQLLKHDCYLSFGKALLNPHSHASKALVEVPLERLFLETDAAVDVSIGSIYAAAAKIVGLQLETLQQHILSNFKRVFLND